MQILIIHNSFYKITSRCSIKEVGGDHKGFDISW